MNDFKTDKLDDAPGKPEQSPETPTAPDESTNDVPSSADCDDAPTEAVMTEHDAPEKTAIAEPNETESAEAEEPESTRPAIRNRPSRKKRSLMTRRSMTRRSMTRRSMSRNRKPWPPISTTRCPNGLYRKPS